MMYEPRFYRSWSNAQLGSCQVSYKETDLLIRSPKLYPDLCMDTIKTLRHRLDDYLVKHPDFLSSLHPIDIVEEAPEEVRQMANCASLANVGPMAAVAGMFAEKVGKVLLEKVDEVIVENGGDIFLAVQQEQVIGVYAGEKSPFSGKIGIRIAANQTPLGICTSAGTVGPSLSLGRADAVTVLCRSTPLADAVATAVGNRIHCSNDIDAALKWGQSIRGVTGLLVIKDQKLGVWGELEIVKTKICQ